uniref:Uncharacterized protein n=1 Tax=Oryza nivara TaxID=4536 RepID=A0A0E0FU08_ORYNI
MIVACHRPWRGAVRAVVTDGGREERERKLGRKKHLRIYHSLSSRSTSCGSSEFILVESADRLRSWCPLKRADS